MSLIRINLGKFKPDGFGFKVQDKNGKLIVTQVFDNSIALERGLRCNDVIYFVNNEAVSVTATEFAHKIMQIKGKVNLLVYRPKSHTQSQHSYNNLSSSESDQISGINTQKMKMSRSSIDLHSPDFSDNITESNFVPEDQIDCYMMLPGDNHDEVTEEIQITRKNAYRKVSADVRNVDSPRFSVKKATKSTSVYSKDPNITIKKRINTYKTGDTVTSNQRRRPINTNKHVLDIDLSTNNDRGIPRSIVPPETLAQSPLASSQIKMPESNLQGNDENDSWKSIQVEVQMKILSFKEKIKKPTWKRFMVENDSLGVWFHSLEEDETPIGCNSMAIDPYISGLDFYMISWHSNNSLAKFFIPIGQPSYDAGIVAVCTVDNVHVTYKKYELDFLIDLQKMPEDRLATLSTLLAVDLDSRVDSRPTQTKTKKYHGSAENLKFDRRQKTTRYGTELPRVSLVSCLPQTKIVKDVPLVVVICVNVIETLGIKTEGIYRKSGNEGLRKKLESIVANECCEKWMIHEEWTNVNTVCSLLKNVLRGFCLIDRDTAIKLSMINLHGGDTASGEQEYMDMVYHLRQRLCKTDSRRDSGTRDRSSLERRCRLDTFKYILKHLYRVSRFWNCNKMNGDNLATCFWPTIIEDIPCYEDGNYQMSKKSDADRNLNQIVAFWITNADLICQLLDDDDEQRRHQTLIAFCQATDAVSDNLEMVDPMSVAEKDAADIVRELIEYYTSEYFVPMCESLSHSTLTTPIVNSGVKRDNHKQGKRDRPLRRSSTSLSPKINTRKMNFPLGALSPVTRKKIDNWATKAIRTKKKTDVIVPPLALKKEVYFSSQRLSGSVKNVPLVVDVCISIITKYGLDVDGLYRISARKQDITELNNLIHNDQYLSWYQEPHLSLWTDIYTVSCVLKSFLKQFSLIGKETWSYLSSVISGRMQADEVRQLLLTTAYHFSRDTKTSSTDEKKDLENEIRCATLRHVLRHLKTVTRHSYNNLMSSASLAVCFMPVLMDDNDFTDLDMTVNLKGIQIIEKWIDHCEWIFQWVDRPCEDIDMKMMGDSLDEYLRRYSLNEISSMIPKIGTYDMAQHIIEDEEARVIVEKLVKQSNMATYNRWRCQRYSESSDSTSLRRSDPSDDDTGTQKNGNITPVLYKESIL